MVTSVEPRCQNLVTDRDAELDAIVVMPEDAGLIEQSSDDGTPALRVTSAAPTLAEPWPWPARELTPRRCWRLCLRRNAP